MHGNMKVKYIIMLIILLLVFLNVMLKRNIRTIREEINKEYISQHRWGVAILVNFQKIN